MNKDELIDTLTPRHFTKELDIDFYNEKFHAVKSNHISMSVVLERFNYNYMSNYVKELMLSDEFRKVSFDNKINHLRNNHKDMIYFYLDSYILFYKENNPLKFKYIRFNKENYLI